MPPMAPTTTNSAADAASAPAALTAFLRGVERRGAVFAQLQVGDAQTGDRALVAAMRAFRLPAARIPVADWPRQFWTLLLATHELRETPESPEWGSGFGFLAQLGRGPRAALLLRLVAGLAETDAAAVLGVARPTYRVALQRALPHTDDGRPDAEAWRMLGEASQHAVRDVSVERMGHLAWMREAVIHGRRLDPPKRVVPTADRDVEASHARWRRPSMLAVAAATLLAFLATFLLPLDDPAPEFGPSGVHISALPPAAAPEATFDAQTALLTHPDFELLAEDGVEPAARAPAFYAWLAAGAELPDYAISPEAAPEAGSVPTRPDDAPPETEDEP